jgi:hypothetical protein
MKKRSHRNTSRLTAKERAEAYFAARTLKDAVTLLPVLQAHARDTLARYKRRQKTTKA